MKDLLSRFISRIVLISYLASILRLDYGLAMERAEILTLSPPNPTLVLKLRPKPTEYKIKIERKTPSDPSGEGLKIKLKGRGTSRKETLRKFFIPDNNLLSQSDLDQYVLRVQLDEQGQNVIGFVWHLQEFPDLDLFIVRDGSLLLTGSIESPSKLKVTSPYTIHLNNFTAPTVALKAQEIYFSGRINIPHLVSAKGTLINQGLLEANGGLEATSLSNTGEALIRNLFLLNNQFGKFENAGKLSLVNAKVRIQDQGLYNQGTFILKDSSLFFEEGENHTNRTLDFYNQGTMILMGGGQFGTINNHNRVEIHSGNYDFRQWKNFKDILLLGKHWTVEGATGRKDDNLIKVQSLQNEGGIVAEDALTCTYSPLLGHWQARNFSFAASTHSLENLGSLLVTDRLLVKGSLINRKDLQVQGRSDLTQGSLLNEGTVQLEGEAESDTFTNTGTLKAIKGITVHTFRNSGEAAINNLFVLNREFKNTGQLTLHGTRIRVHDQGLLNHGTLLLDRGTLLFHPGEDHSNRTLDFYNEGTLTLKGGGQFGTINNHNRVEIEAGNYIFRQWKNYKNIFLLGENWTIAGSTNPKESPSLTIKRLENNGTITAEGKVVYGYDFNPIGWEAQTFLLRLPTYTLTPKNLAGIKANRVEIETRSFEVAEESTLLIPYLLLKLTGHFHVNRNLSLQTLEAYADGEFRCGSSNDAMASLITTGALTVSADAINARFAKIFSSGKTILQATRNHIQIGNVKEVPSSIPSFSKPMLNGAYVASNGEMILHSFLGHIYNKSEIFAKGTLALKARPDTGFVHSQFGKIIAFGDITVEGHRFAIAKSIPVHLFPPRSTYREIGQRYHSYLICLEDTPLLQSLANIHFKTQEVVNQAADIYAGGSISHQGSQFTTTSFKQQLYVYFRNKFGREDYYLNNYEDAVARVIAGQTIGIIDASNIHLTGMTSGHQIGFKAETFTAKNVGSDSRTSTLSRLLNLADYGKQLYGSTGFIKALSDGTITTDVPISGGLKPPISQQLYVTAEANPTSSLNPNPSQQFLIDPVPLQFMVQQALAQYGGTLNVKGRSGEELNQYLLDNAADLIKQHGSALLSKQLLQDHPKSLLAFLLNSGNKAIPLLKIEQEDINQYQQSGDIHSNTTVDIHTIKSQQHIGNRVVGKSGITLTSEGTLEAASTVTTNKTYEGKKTVTRESISYLQQFLSNGDIHLAAKDTLKLTASQVISGKDIILDGGTVEVSGIVMKETSTETSKKKGFTSTQWKYEHTETPTFQQALLAAAGKIHFTKKTRSATLAGTVVQAQTLINDTTEGVTLKPLVGLHHHIVHTKQKNPLSGVAMKVDQGQEVMCPSVLAVQEVLTENSPLTLISVDWDKEQTRIEGLYEEAIQHLNSWNHVEVKKSGVPPEALAIAAVAFTVLTAGTGGTTLLSTLQSFMTGSTTLGEVAATTMTMFGRTVGACLINNGLNVEATLKQTFSRESFKALALSLAAEGILGGVGMASPKDYAPLSQIAAYEAQKALVTAGVGIAFKQQKLKDALKGAGINFIASTMGRSGAETIGKAYGDGNLGFLEHKALHGLLGAGVGALKGDAIAGALGGMVGEMVADMTKEDTQKIAISVVERSEREGIPLTEQTLDLLVAQEMKSTLDWSKIAAATVTTLAGHNINIGLETATTALEHNFLPMIIGAVYVAGLAMTAYDAVDAYEESGMEGAIESLATDITMGALTGGTFKVIGKGAKVAWKGATKTASKEAVQKAVKNEGKESAKNIANHQKYKDGLKQQERLGHQAEKAAEQLNEIKKTGGREMAGPTHKRPVIDEPRLIAQYGGKPGDWVKVTSDAVKTEKGTMQTHAYRNTKTGEVVEAKLKFQ